jgi:predicted nucleotidyltransferase
MKVDCGLSERILSRFIEITSSAANVQKLILFGSRAQGRYKYNSDIDLAFQCAGPIINSQYELDMEEAAELYKLDLLDVGTIKDDVLLQQIEQGIILFERT